MLGDTMRNQSKLNEAIKESESRTIKIGQIWKHYKGGLYKIICISKFEPDPTKHVVTYEPMYETDENMPWSRFLNVFLEPVKLTGFDLKGNPQVINRFELETDV